MRDYSRLCCIYWLYIKMDDASPLPPAVQKRSQNICDTSGAVLLWVHHLEPESYTCPTRLHAGPSYPLEKHLNIHQRDKNSLVWPIAQPLAFRRRSLLIKWNQALCICVFLLFFPVVPNSGPLLSSVYSQTLTFTPYSVLLLGFIPVQVHSGTSGQSSKESWPINIKVNPLTRDTLSIRAPPCDVRLVFDEHSSSLIHSHSNIQTHALDMRYTPVYILPHPHVKTEPEWEVIVYLNGMTSYACLCSLTLFNHYLNSVQLFS